MQAISAVLVVLITLWGFSNSAPQPRIKDVEEIPNLTEGDMLLRSHNKNGMIGEQYKWPKGEVIYQLALDFTTDERERIFAGWAEISNTTCITFRPREPTDPDWVYVQRGSAGSGCYSEVGKVGGLQVLNLEPSGNCISRHGTIIHEMLHAIGFYHEQSRSDRDDYVTIVWDKIQPGLENNFEKYNASEVTSFGAPYDYGSVLHYGPTGFSTDGSPTIITKIPGVEIGQRLNISQIDAGKVRLMYNCTVQN